MARWGFKPAGVRQRFDRTDPVAALTPIVAGTYYGFWDITAPGGAESIAAAAPLNNNDPIHRVVQLQPGSTASDMTWWDADTGLVQQEQAYRRDIICETGRTFPKKPAMFYRRSYWTESSGGFGNLMELHATLNYPPTDPPILAYTTAVAGVKTLHELGLPAELVEAVGGAAAANFPVPREPGVMIVVTTLSGSVPVAPTTRVYVNGTEVDATGAASTDPIDPAVGFDPDSFLRTFGMPCWATQKMFVMTKEPSPAEIQAMTEAFLGSMEVDQ